MIPAGSMEVNATDKAFLSVDGTATLTSCSYHSATVDASLQCTHPESKARVVRSSSTGKRPSSSERKPRRSLDPLSQLISYLLCVSSVCLNECLYCVLLIPLLWKNISSSSSIVGKMLSSSTNPSQEHRKPLSSSIRNLPPCNS